MSIDKDPEVFKLLIGGVVFLLGILNTFLVKRLDNLKNTDAEIFRRLNRTDREISDKLAMIGERVARVESKCEGK
jgi:hypothetical protein